MGFTQQRSGSCQVGITLRALKVTRVEFLLRTKPWTQYADRETGLSSEPQEIPKQPIAVGSEETFRVKLNALDREVTVLKTHDFKWLAFVMDPRGDFETGRHRFFGYDEAMVAGCHERIGQMCKDT